MQRYYEVVRKRCPSAIIIFKILSFLVKLAHLDNQDLNRVT